MTVELPEYRFALNVNSSTSVALIPYAVEPLTQRELRAAFPIALQNAGITALTVNVPVDANPLACLYSPTRFMVEREGDYVPLIGVNAVLRVGDLLQAEFLSPVYPTKITLCGQNVFPIPQLALETYTVYTTVPAEAGGFPCQLLVYSSLQSGVLAVVESSTDVIVDPFQGELHDCL